MMRLGDLLLARGLVSSDQIKQALQRQHLHGGRLGENLVTLGHLSDDALEAVLHETPRAPKNLAVTGTSRDCLQSLLLKFMHAQGLAQCARLAVALKLPIHVTAELLAGAAENNHVEQVAANGIGAAGELCYALTESGRAAAGDAFERCGYLGPAPISLEAYQEQILTQRITNERLDPSSIGRRFEGLTLPQDLIRKLGPAIDAGRSVLLYGASGNGKTAIATQIFRLFAQVIYVPYAVEIDGQIMQVYDPRVHSPAISRKSAALMEKRCEGLHGDAFDQRWLPIHRPSIAVGSELSLEMLDLRYDEVGKFYEAPLHVKAMGGVFVIDDFGRQSISPKALLNRWLVAMESRIDFLKLKSGKSFYLPFDELLIFATDRAPEDLMDQAFLRRIPYKIELPAPSEEDFKTVFKIAAKAAGMVLSEAVYSFVLDRLSETHNSPLAYFQPQFIVDQVVSACRYDGGAPHLSIERVEQALANLYPKISKNKKKPKSASTRVKQARADNVVKLAAA